MDRLVTEMAALRGGVADDGGVAPVKDSSHDTKEWTESRDRLFLGHCRALSTSSSRSQSCRGFWIVTDELATC